MKRYMIILALLAVSAVLVVGAATGSKNAPPAPPTSNSPFASGQDTFGVDGPDGQPVICANGKELRVSKELLRAKPPLPNGKVRPDNGKEKVWRCGTGPDPDKHPRLVDAG